LRLNLSFTRHSIRAGFESVGVQDDADGKGSRLQYRLYFIDGDGHMVGTPYEFEAPDDETAVKVARSWSGERKVELWCRHRRIAV
jgi:hypothetical protein